MRCEIADLKDPRVPRGGGWRVVSTVCARAVYRGKCDPSDPGLSYGVRLSVPFFTPTEVEVTDA